MDKNYCLQDGQNDGWIMVNTKDGLRSPQYNGDNEPSGRRANASTLPSRHESFSFEEIEAFGQDLPPVLGQGTRFNGSSETMTSTSTEDRIARPHAQYGPKRVSSKARETLTQSNLHLNEHLDTVNVSGWIANSGTSLRFAQYQTDPTTHRSMVAERPIPSTTGSGAYGETSGPQSPVGSEDIVAIGAWADDPIEAIRLINSSRPDSE